MDMRVISDGTEIARKQEGPMAARAGMRSFGRIRKLPSGYYHASYIGPYGDRHCAPQTFGAKVDA